MIHILRSSPPAARSADWTRREIARSDRAGSWEFGVPIRDLTGGAVFFRSWKVAVREASGREAETRCIAPDITQTPPPVASAQLLH